MKTKIPKLVTISLIVLLSVMAIVSMGVSGDGSCDSTEVQQPLNEGRTNYEQFLRQIGARRGFGIPQPWITVPEDGATVTGVFEIKGWSAIAADVPEVDQSAQSIVRIYAVPSAQYQEGDISSYLANELEVSLPVPVNQSTREWITQIDDSKLPQGEVVLLAVTQIGGMKSFPNSIKVNAPNGKAKPFVPGGNWPPHSETLSLICVFVRTPSKNFNDSDEVNFKNEISRVEKYFRDVSRGQVKIQMIALLKDSNGQDYKLQVDDINYYISLAEGEGHAIKFFEEVYSMNGVQEAIPKNGDPYSIIAFFPGTYRAWSLPLSSALTPNAEKEGKPVKPGSFMQISSEELKSMRPAIAHEIAHGLGISKNSDAKYSQLPDLYMDEDNKPVGYSNLKNFAKWDNGRYFLMSSNAKVSPSSYSQEWLGWLVWQNLQPGSEPFDIMVPYLDGLNEPVKTVPRLLKPEDDGKREAYTIIEARGKDKAGHGEWEANIPKTAVIVYKIREYKKGVVDALAPGWPRSIDFKAELTSKKPWINIDDQYTLTLTSDLASLNGHETVYYNNVKSYQIFSDIFSVSGPKMTGSLLKASLDGAPVLKSNSPLVEQPETENNDVEIKLPFPDLDLHAYLADGTHIGMNYETGQFENPVEGSIVSGDMSMDSEWILVPEQMAQGIQFEISSHDTQQFAEKFPEMAEGQSLDLDYSIEPAVYDETNNSIYKGEQLKGTLGAGQATNMPMIITEDNISLKPYQPFWREPAFIMGAIAGVLLIPGVGLLAWSIKGMRKK